MRVFNRNVFVWGTQPLNKILKILQIQTSEIRVIPKLAKDTEYSEHYGSDEEYEEP